MDYERRRTPREIARIVALAMTARRRTTTASVKPNGVPKDIDAYIAAAPNEVRSILRAIRETISAAAPGAEEVISYRIPAFKWNGRILAYFAAFKHHIGFFPPVRGDAALVKAAAKYAGAKGNLRFPLDEPMPYALIAKIIRSRVRQHDQAYPPRSH
jgi:uncharacterized protein YdhG (YjbR/CyaY superfamily)